MESDRGAFVFAADGVAFFMTIDEAARSLEQIDVENGEYEAFFALTGERLLPEFPDQIKVQLVSAGDSDSDALRSLLRREHDLRATFVADPGDPTAFADELLLREWTWRWPRWPRWLDRRLHGEGPA